MGKITKEMIEAAAEVLMQQLLRPTEPSWADLNAVCRNRAELILGAAEAVRPSATPKPPTTD